MKNLKSVFTKAISVIVIISLLASCSATPTSSSKTPQSGNAPTSNAVSERKPFKIAILEALLNDESVNRAKYFNEYIAPQYNCEFMFSEAISEIDKAMTYIENASDAGCNAIISYYPTAANTEQLVQLCQELDMVYAENGGRSKTNEAAYTGNYESFSGGFMANQPDTGKLFYDYLSQEMDTTAEHGILIGTGSAYQGNAQQTEISTNMLNAIEEVYDLKFENTITELITAAAPIDAINNKGIAINCYPGNANLAGWLEGIAAALQTGKYDYLLMAPQAIGQIGNVVSEAEVALNKDITVVAFGAFGEALTNALNTKDKFGNQSISMSTVKFTSIVSAMAFSQVYNSLTDNKAALLDADGNPTVLLFRMQSVTSPEQLAEMSSWDTADKWVADYAFVDSLLAEKNPGMKAADIQKNIYDITYDSIKARLG